MRGIGNILFGGVFVAGGLSGKLALIGTSSSGALVVLGGAMLAWGIYQATQGSDEPAE